MVNKKLCLSVISLALIVIVGLAFFYHSSSTLDAPATSIQKIDELHSLLRSSLSIRSVERLGEIDEAIERVEAESLLLLKDFDFNNDFLIRSLYEHKATIRELDGDYQGAIYELTQIINRGSAKRSFVDWRIAYSSRASLKKKVGDKSGAIEDYSFAIEYSKQDIKENPDSPVSDISLALLFFQRGVLRQQTGNWYGARADYTEVIELRRDSYWAYLAYYNRAGVHIRLKDQVSAKKDIEKVDELEQQYPEYVDERIKNIRNL